LPLLLLLQFRELQDVLAELKAGHAGQLAAAQQQVAQLSDRLSQQLQASSGNSSSSRNASCKRSDSPGQQQQQQQTVPEPNQQVRQLVLPGWL
jgi:Skp family chaperone for outer membrane proteins